MFLDENGNIAYLKFIHVNTKANRYVMSTSVYHMFVDIYLVYLYEFLFTRVCNLEVPGRNDNDRCPLSPEVHYLTDKRTAT